MLTLNPMYGLTDSQINYFLKHQKNFKGCFPIDKIPIFYTFPTYIIVNTAPSYSRGEHWVGLIIRKNDFIYFDSFGLPVMNEYLFQYFKQYDTRRVIIHSRVCIQNISSYACGLFVIAFVKHVKNLNGYHLFIDKFDHVNLLENDVIAWKLVQ